MKEQEFELLDVRDVVIYTGKVLRFNGEEFNEGKKRPSIIVSKKIIDGNDFILAVPFNSTVDEPWRGPSARYCIVPDKEYVEYLKTLSNDEIEEIFGETDIDFKNFNNLEKVSQVAVSNAFYLGRNNFVKKIGRTDAGDYEAIKYMMNGYLNWVRKNLESLS